MEFLCGFSKVGFVENYGLRKIQPDMYSFLIFKNCWNYRQEKLVFQKRQKKINNSSVCYMWDEAKGHFVFILKKRKNCANFIPQNARWNHSTAALSLFTRPLTWVICIILHSTFVSYHAHSMSRFRGSSKIIE